jgi:hypothetical protein
VSAPITTFFSPSPPVNLTKCPFTAETHRKRRRNNQDATASAAFISCLRFFGFHVATLSVLKSRTMLIIEELLRTVDVYVRLPVSRHVVGVDINAANDQSLSAVSILIFILSRPPSQLLIS